MTPSPTTAARPARAADSPGAASKSTTLAKFVDDGDDILDSSGRIRFLTAERHSYASKRPPNPNPMLDEVEDGLWERRKRRAEERRSAESDSQKLGAKKKFVYRPRQTGTKIADPANFMPVQPWDTVRSSLETMTRSSKTGEDSVEQLESATVEENTALEGSGTAVTIPFGFQLLRRLPSSRSAIRSALHLPISTSTDHFVTIDSHNLSLWRGTSLKTRLAMASTRTIQSRSTRTPTTTVPQIQKWMYIEKFHVFVVFSSSSHLMLLDNHFGELCSVNSCKPILSFEFIESKDELVTGEVGGVRLWKIAREISHHQEIFSLTEVRTICDLGGDVWVDIVCWERIQERIIAICEADVYVFEHRSGQRLDYMKEIHEMSITSCVFYEHSEYLITGAKCGKIRVWNSQNCLVYEFNGHYRAVTSLNLLESVSKAASGTQPIVISSSLDRTIRMWNFNTGACLYRLDTAGEVIKMRFFKSDTFYIYSSKSVEVWRVHRSHRTFLQTNARPLIISRCERAAKPPRLVVAASDGSVRVVNPRSGDVVRAGFPIFTDTSVTHAVHDVLNDIVFARQSNHDVVVFSCSTNPMKVVDHWSGADFSEPWSCFEGVLLKASAHGQSFHLIAGALDGRLIHLSTEHKGRQTAVVQAHGAAILNIHVDQPNLVLVSVGKDLQLKAWKIVFDPDAAKLAMSFSLDDVDGPIRSPITLSLLSSVNLVEFGPNCLNGSISTAVNPHSELVACSVKGSLLVCDYSGHVFSRPKEFDKRNSSVLSVSSLSSFNLWATADEDHTVRLWDNFGSMLREIQFNEHVSCVQTANERGDLLVSLSDQIAVVWLQEYCTTHMAQMALKRGFSDDLLEDPLVFDSNMDFWDYFYEAQSKLDKNLRWHIPKDFNVSSLPEGLKNFVKELRFQPEQDEEVIRKRRNRRLFLEKEAGIFMRAAGYEERLVLSKQNAAHAKNWTVELGESMTSLYEETTEDLERLMRMSSDVNLLPTGVLELKSPRPEFDYGSNIPTLAEDDAPVLSPEILEVCTKEPAKKPSADKHSVQAPEKIYKKVSAAEMEKRREIIRKRLLANGIALPNSVVKRETTQDHRKPAPSRQHSKVENKQDSTGLARILRARKAKDDGFNHTPKYIGGRGPSTLNNEHLEKTESQEILPVRDYDLVHRESMSVDPDLGQQQFMMFKPKSNEEILEEDDSDGVASWGKSSARRAPSVKAVREQSIKADVDLCDDDDDNDEQKDDVDTNAVIEVAEPPPTVKLPAHSPVPTKEPDRVLSAPRVVRKPPEPSTSSEKNSALAPAPISNHAKRPPSTTKFAPARQLGTKREKRPLPAAVSPQQTAPDKLFVEVPTSEAPIQPNLELPEIKEPEQVSQLENTTEKSASEMESVAWGLLRLRRLSAISNVISSITSMFWFPGIKDDEVNLATVTKVLLALIKDGLWSERCEASKALLYLYKTFEKDFVDPFHLLVKPQLEAMYSCEYWQVRAQFCLNIVGYNIREKEVILALMARLRDYNSTVRGCASRALAGWDISSRAQLKNAMQTSGIIPNDRRPTDRLDSFMKELKREQAAAAAESAESVAAWCEKVPFTAFPTFVRQNSYKEHLAGPFFPPDSPSRPSQAVAPTAARGQINNPQAPPEILPESFMWAVGGGGGGSVAASNMEGVSEGWDVRSARTRHSGPRPSTSYHYTVQPSARKSSAAAYRPSTASSVSSGGGRPPSIPPLVSIVASVRSFSAGKRMMAKRKLANAQFRPCSAQ